jgi:aminoglycoside 6'-N-acetyltransferase
MPELVGERVRLRPIREDDVAPLRAIRTAPEVARWWGALEDGFPLADEPTATRFAIVDDGAVTGMIQYGEEQEPDYRHASIDLFLDPARHGEGLGTDAVRTLARHLMDEGGHHRITIDPAVHNVAAVRAYEKAGFRTVGVMRSSWRDPDGVWHDSLLMELVAMPERAKD